MISCGAAFEFETSRHRFCDISTVVIFEHPDDLILSCVSWIQAIREIEVFLEPLLVTTCLHLQSRADLQEFFRTRVSRHDV